MADNFTVNAVTVRAKDNASVYTQAVFHEDNAGAYLPLATSTLQGALTETAPATDTASSGLNGRLQRIAQRLTSLIALLPSALGGAGGLKVEIVAGGGTGGTALADEGTFTLAATSVTPIAGVYNATPDTLATGKAGALQMSVARALHVHMVGDDVGEAAVAHDAVDTGNPLKIGGQARSSDPTAVTNADRTNATFTLLGKQIVYPYATPALTWTYAATAGGLLSITGVTAKAAAGASIRNYVSSAQITNSHQTISTEVVIRDGAAGTVLHRIWAQAAGGGETCKFDPPLRGTANTLIEIGEISTTATAGVLVNLQGFQATE